MAGSSKIKGITIEIGGNTYGLDKALSGVNKASIELQNELKDVERLLKLDPTNTELLTQKQKLLGEAVTNTKNKLDTLKDAEKQAQEQFKQGKITEEQYRALQREIVKTEQNLKKLETAGKKSAEQIGKSFKDAGEKISGIGNKMLPVTAAVAGAGAAAIKFASDYEESLNKVNVAFGDSAAGVIEWSETTLQNFGIASGSALDMAALFGDMSTSLGLSDAQAAQMSQSLVGLAGDLASFKNIGIDEAETALKSIFTGETESLKNLGIVMTQANLNAYAMANGFGKTTDQMTQAEQVQLRYAYVMDMTKNAQGDFANTSDGTANSMRTLSETLKELAVQFGEVLLPIITPIIQKLTSFIAKISSMDEGTRKMILTVAGIAAVVGPLLILIGKMSMGVGAIIKILPGLKAGIGAVNAVLKANPILLVVGLLAMLAVWLVKTYQTNEEFRNKVNAAFNSIKEVVTGVINAVKEKVAAFLEIGKNIVTGIWNGINGAKDWLLNNVKEWCGSLLKGIKAFFGIKSPSTVFRDQVGKNIVLGIDKGIKDNGKTVIKTAGELSQHILSEATSWVEDKQFYNQMSLDDELAFWEDLKTMSGLQANEIAEIDKKIYTAKQSLIEKSKQEQEEFENSVKSRADAISSFAGIFDEVTRDTDVSGKQLIQNLQSQVKAMQRWQSGIAELADRGINGGLLEELRNAGPQAADEIRALTKLSDEELTKYAQLFETKTKLANDQALLELSPLQNALQSIANTDISSALSNLEGNINYAVSPVSNYVAPTETNVAEVVGQALMNGLTEIGDMIFAAIPKQAAFNVDGRQMAVITWDDYTAEGKKRGKIFAPSREQIANIAMSVLPSTL